MAGRRLARQHRRPVHNNNYESDGETICGMAFTAEETTTSIVASSPRCAGTLAMRTAAHRAPPTSTETLPSHMHYRLARSTALRSPDRVHGPSLWVEGTPRPTPLACRKAVVARAAASEAGHPS